MFEFKSAVKSVMLFVLLIISTSIQAKSIDCSVSSKDNLKSECKYLLDNKEEYLFKLIDRKSKEVLFKPMEGGFRFNETLIKKDGWNVLSDFRIKTDTPHEAMAFDDSLNDIKYLTINGARAYITTKKVYWYGIYCHQQESPELLAKKDHFPLYWAYSTVCSNEQGTTNYPYPDSEFVGNDQIVTIPKIINHQHSQDIKVIIFDENAADGNYAKLDYVGCIKNCYPFEGDITLNGRIIDQASIEMTLNIAKDRQITGKYRYYSYEQEEFLFKKLSGSMTENNIELSATDKSNTVIETFKGETDDGKFSGVWHDIKTDESKPFELYLSLDISRL